MPKIDKKLMPCEVNQGLLYVTELRHLFPESSRPVTVIDSDGQKFHWRMHSSQPRIDGLTKLHRKHKSRIGQTVIIEVNPSQAATAYVVFEDAPTQTGDFTLEDFPRPEKTIEQDALARWISSGAGFGNPETNRKVERAAIKHATNWYKARGWNVRSTEANKCGYDLYCRRGVVEEYVEVKGVQGELPSFIITQGEVRQAENNPYFVVFVVTSALSDNSRIYRYTGTELMNNFDLSPLAYRVSLRK